MNILLVIELIKEMNVNLKRIADALEESNHMMEEFRRK